MLYDFVDGHMVRCPFIPAGLCVSCACGAKNVYPPLLPIGKLYIRSKPSCDYCNTFIYCYNTYNKYPILYTCNRLNSLKTKNLYNNTIDSVQKKKRRKKKVVYNFVHNSYVMRAHTRFRKTGPITRYRVVGEIAPG